MLQRTQKFLISRSGATAIEYGLIAALVSASIIFGMELIGGNISSLFSEASDNLK